MTETYPGQPNSAHPNGGLLEMGPPADLAISETQLAGATLPANAAELPGTTLQYEGFVSGEQRQALVAGITALGLPVEGLSTVRYQSNLGEQDDRSRFVSLESGVLTIGEAFYAERPPEAQLGILAQELVRANSALRPENSHLYGGEAGRAEVAVRLEAMASQSLLTGKYLDGQQKRFARQYTSGEISFADYIAHTEAIAGRLALTNRNKLVQTEATQHAVVAKRKLAGDLPADTEPVHLTSRATEQGNIIIDGIDAQVMSLLQQGRGITSFTAFLGHIQSLKSHFYSAENNQIADERWNAMLANLHLEWAMQMERRMRERAAEIDGDTKRKKERVAKGRGLWLSRELVVVDIPTAATQRAKADSN